MYKKIKINQIKHENCNNINKFIYKNSFCCDKVSEDSYISSKKKLSFIKNSTREGSKNMEKTRKEWVTAMLEIASPVLDALEQSELKKSMPLTFHSEKSAFAPLEAFGRTMLGIAPWLELDEKELEDEERNLQSTYRKKVINCIQQATDSSSVDFMLFDKGGQPLVDAAFLCHALVRAPKQIASKLNASTKRNLVAALRSTRKIVAHNSNWIFFSAMVEAGLFILGESYDMMRILYALRQFSSWYKGDGVYGDGPNFHWDYYNSFVIQPMYVDLVDLFSEIHPEVEAMKPAVITRATRYASILERLISPEGSYPIIGRSICYRFGAFQLLAQCALQNRLEQGLSPASVRCALTAVMQRVINTKSMFDENGWLLPGVIGEQEELAEQYINVGSLYLCTAFFLPLGLSPKSDFWSTPDEDWTSKKVWSGQHSRIDHAIEI